MADRPQEQPANSPPARQLRSRARAQRPRQRWLVGDQRQATGDLRKEDLVDPGPDCGSEPSGRSVKSVTSVIFYLYPEKPSRACAGRLFDCEHVQIEQL